MLNQTDKVVCTQLIGGTQSVPLVPHLTDKCANEILMGVCLTQESCTLVDSLAKCGFCNTRDAYKISLVQLSSEQSWDVQITQNGPFPCHGNYKNQRTSFSIFKVKGLDSEHSVKSCHCPTQCKLKK